MLRLECLLLASWWIVPYVGSLESTGDSDVLKLRVRGMSVAGSRWFGSCEVMGNDLSSVCIYRLSPLKTALRRKLTVALAPLFMNLWVNYLGKSVPLP